MSAMFSDEKWMPEGAISVDLRNLQGTSCYCSAEAKASILQSIKALPVKSLHWIDGGDYHYLSALWMSRLDKKTELLLIDNHPDDQPPAFGSSLLSCGSWVDFVRKNNPMLAGRADNLYVSIDLDFLSRDYARTNWDQGTATLEELFRLLDEKTAGKSIAGVDVCGGVTRAQGGTEEDFAINRRTRNAILEYFTCSARLHF